MFVVIIFLFEKKATSKQCVDNGLFSKMSFLNVHFVCSENEVICLRRTVTYILWVYIIINAPLFPD